MPSFIILLDKIEIFFPLTFKSWLTSFQVSRKVTLKESIRKNSTSNKDFRKQSAKNRGSVRPGQVNFKGGRVSARAKYQIILPYVHLEHILHSTKETKWRNESIPNSFIYLERALKKRNLKICFQLIKSRKYDSFFLNIFLLTFFSIFPLGTAFIA